jgi:galactokinase
VSEPLDYDNYVSLAQGSQQRANETLHISDDVPEINEAVAASNRIDHQAARHPAGRFGGCAMFQ